MEIYCLETFACTLKSVWVLVYQESEEDLKFDSDLTTPWEKAKLLKGLKC